MFEEKLIKVMNTLNQFSFIKLNAKFIKLNAQSKNALCNTDKNLQSKTILDIINYKLSFNYNFGGIFH